jgi:hypothetical protein
MNGRVGVVRALLEKGADHTIADHYGRSPIYMAKHGAVYPRVACVEALEVR